MTHIWKIERVLRVKTTMFAVQVKMVKRCNFIKIQLLLAND